MVLSASKQKQILKKFFDIMSHVSMTSGIHALKDSCIIYLFP